MKEYRNIIEIDRDRCNGCGQCVLDCAEGAIAIIDGKAAVVSDSYCDGLGACLSGCPQNALAIVRREAAPFDEEAAMRHVARQKEARRQQLFQPLGKQEPHGTLGCGCSGTTVHEFAPRKPQGNEAAGPVGERRQTWPVKLRLVPPSAPFLKGADILLAADCSAPASARFHEIASGKVVLIACPKFEDNQEMRARLVALFTEARPSSVTALRMEVPCCRGIAAVCREAAGECGIPVHELVMGRDGELCPMNG